MENITVSMVVDEIVFRDMLKICPTQLGDEVIKKMGIVGQCTAFCYYFETGKYVIDWKTPEGRHWDAEVEYWQFRDLFNTKKVEFTVELNEY